MPQERSTEDRYEMSKRDTIGSRIKSLRVKYNETREEVALALKLTTRKIRDYECDQRIPGLETIARYAKHYKVTLDYIVYGDRHDNAKASH